MNAIALKLVASDRRHLLEYVWSQTAHFYPDGREEGRAVIDLHLDEALRRLALCIESVLAWEPGEFNYLHSSQYATFLYFLANSIWRKEGPLPVCAKLFGLNKTLNAIDLFYEIQMPQFFFIGHSVGVVLAKATYGENLVLYQNSTVGRNHGRAPVLGAGTILYPNSAIIGHCNVGPRTTVSQGASLIDQDTPGACIVFPQPGPEALVKPTGRNYLEEYFRGM
jgi:serine O-acetyltransferase